MLILMLAAALELAAGHAPPVLQAQATSPAAGVTRLPVPGGTRGTNPFGLLLGARTLDARARVEVVRRLGARYCRPVDAVAADRPAAPCPECDAARDGGLRLVLTVRANGGGVLHPTTPPADLDAYRRGVAQWLDRYRPALLAVENEENSDLFYRGTPAQYLAELKAACAVAHERGIPCTNGGLVSALVVALVAEAYRGARGRAQVARGKALVAGYREAGADYVNFHWYVKDARALGDALAYLKSATGLEPISNEVGQTGTDDPALVAGLLQKIIEADLPLAVWFSVDTAPGRARALTDDRGTLRATGDAFQRTVRSLSR